MRTHVLLVVPLIAILLGGCNQRPPSPQPSPPPPPNTAAQTSTPQLFTIPTLNLTFRFLPDPNLWVATAPVTPAQYKALKSLPAEVRETDSYIHSISLEQAQAYTTALNTMAKPRGFESWRYAVPTTNQWLTMVRITQETPDLNMGLSSAGEWCSDPAQQLAQVGIYSVRRKLPLIENIIHPGPFVTLRVFLVPPTP